MARWWGYFYPSLRRERDHKNRPLSGAPRGAPGRQDDPPRLARRTFVGQWQVVRASKTPLAKGLLVLARFY